MLYLNIFTYVCIIVFNIVLWQTLGGQSSKVLASLVIAQSLFILVVGLAPLYLKFIAKADKIDLKHKFVMRPFYVLAAITVYMLATAGAFGLAVLAIASALYFAGILIDSLITKSRRRHK